MLRCLVWLLVEVAVAGLTSNLESSQYLHKRLLRTLNKTENSFDLIGKFFSSPFVLLIVPN